MNRLIRSENNNDGKVVEYQYDEVGNRLLMGTYEPLTITATAGNNGSISPSGTITAPYKSSKAFTITPNTGYLITDVLVDGSTAGAVSNWTVLIAVSADAQ